MEVEHSDVIILSFCDDNTFIGSFHNVTEAFPTFKQKAARINLQIQDSKHQSIQKIHSYKKKLINVISFK